MELRLRQQISSPRLGGAAVTSRGARRTNLRPTRPMGLQQHRPDACKYSWLILSLDTNLPPELGTLSSTPSSSVRGVDPSSLSVFERDRFDTTTTATATRIRLPAACGARHISFCPPISLAPALIRLASRETRGKEEKFLLPTKLNFVILLPAGSFSDC